MSEHTPGPWSFELHNEDFYIGGETAVCGTFAQDHAGEEEANARLIAAAPELLEALERIRDHTFSPSSTIREWARAAIAKACP